jgi:hypothetical protein
LGPAGKGTTFISAFMKSCLKRQALALFAGELVSNSKNGAFIGPRVRIDRKIPVDAGADTYNQRL